MIGIVIVAHETLSAGLMDTLTHILGPQSALCAVSVDSDRNRDKMEARIAAAVAEVDRGAGVVVVTDLYGASPCNLALPVNQTRDCQIIYGANLPLLLQLAKSRHLPLGEAVRRAVDAGRKYIGTIPDVMPVDEDRQGAE